MTSTQASITPPLRQNVGPLTTTFYPGERCSIPQILGLETVNGTNIAATATPYWAERALAPNLMDVCAPSYLVTTAATCLPGVTNYQDLLGGVMLSGNAWGLGFFYSPGLACPYQWTTATTLASDPSLFSASQPWVKGIRVDTMAPGETIAICCPT
jgi:hypothetical protein